jgi:hypothetical protein
MKFVWVIISLILTLISVWYLCLIVDIAFLNILKLYITNSCIMTFITTLSAHVFNFIMVGSLTSYNPIGLHGLLWE